MNDTLEKLVICVFSLFSVKWLAGILFVTARKSILRWPFIDLTKIPVSSAKIIGADFFQNQAVYYKGEKQQSAEHWLMCYAMLSFYDGKVKFSSAEENLTFPS